MGTPDIILASSSSYRRTLLQRLGLPFQVCAPDVDETPGNGEDASALVVRLALAKARAVADQSAGTLVIGCDQVATLDGGILGKPVDERSNVQQLLDASGRWVHFHTGLCPWSVIAPTGRSARPTSSQIVPARRAASTGTVRSSVPRSEAIESRTSSSDTS